MLLQVWGLSDLFKKVRHGWDGGCRILGVVFAWNCVSPFFDVALKGKLRRQTPESADGSVYYFLVRPAYDTAVQIFNLCIPLAEKYLFRLISPE